MVDDFYIAKILANSTLDWQDQRNWATDEDGRELIIDESKSRVYSVGRYCCWDFNFAEYSLTGSYIGKNTSGITGRDMSHGFTKDSSDNFYLVGRVEENSGAPPYNYRVLKYNQGTGVVWNQKFGLTGVEQKFNKATLDENEDLYAVGYDENNNYDFKVFKLNPSNGAQIWNTTYSTQNDDRGKGLVSDQNGYLYAVGHTTNNEGTRDVLLLKIDQSNGNLVWSKTYDNGLDDVAKDILIHNNKLYVAASSMTEFHGYDLWLLGYDISTDEIFMNYTWGSQKNEYAYALDLDANNNSLYVAGYRDITTSTTNPPYQEFLLAKFTINLAGGGSASNPYSYDSYDVGGWHFDNELLDDTGSSHTLTNGGAVTFNDTEYKFATHSAYFDTTLLSYLYMNDHSDFDLSGGVWTIEAWVKPEYNINTGMIYAQTTGLMGGYVSKSYSRHRFYSFIHHY
ncbi:hypothetical protein GOV05_00925 [Candidatus Woesearchaeota archaeon]|nr:hypothetical protein [Candidatus Woesearchaeota archaeon]